MTLDNLSTLRGSWFGERISIFNSGWRNSLFSAALTLCSVSVLFSTSAFSQGPQTPSCGNFEVINDKRIDGHLFTKGIYKINTFGISCEKVMGKYGLLDQFFSQEDVTPLPKPWRFLSTAIGAPKFSAEPGVGFRLQPVSN